MRQLNFDNEFLFSIDNKNPNCKHVFFFNSFSPFFNGSMRVICVCARIRSLNLSLTPFFFCISIRNKVVFVYLVFLLLFVCQNRFEAQIHQSSYLLWCWKMRTKLSVQKSFVVSILSFVLIFVFSSFIFFFLSSSISSIRFCSVERKEKRKKLWICMMNCLKWNAFPSAKWTLIQSNEMIYPMCNNVCTLLWVNHWRNCMCNALCNYTFVSMKYFFFSSSVAAAWKWIEYEFYVLPFTKQNGISINDESNGAKWT